MNNKYTLCLIILAAVFFGSCAPRVFLPDRVNAPMLQEQGDVKLTGSLKIPGNSFHQSATGSSFDFAASPVRGLGIIASFRHTNLYSNEDNDSIHYSGNRLELGAGYYMPLGSKGLFEIYGGGGFGSFSRDNAQMISDLSENFQSKYYHFFIQPSLGFHIRDIFELSGGIRFAYQKYNSFHSSDSSLRYELTDPASDIEKTSFLFVDPFVNANIGYQYVKFNIQFGGNLCASSPQFAHHNFPAYVSVGLTLEIAPRFRVTKKDKE